MGSRWAVSDAYRTPADEPKHPPQRKSVLIPKSGQRVLMDGEHRLTGIVRFADEKIVGVKLDEGGFLRIRPKRLLILSRHQHWWLLFLTSLQKHIRHA